jgi:acetyltransferase-like isoleucine patch superfamily enzyme
VKIKRLLNKNKVLDSINTIRYSRKFVSLERLHVDGHAGLIIVGSGKIYAGNLTISAIHYPVGIYSGPGSELVLGNIFLNQGVGITCFSKVKIGDETMIGEMTDIMDTDWHGIDGNQPKVEPVFIGKHVWIGLKCIILKGVTIGDYSIVGAGSVVTHSVLPNTIVAGNPAKPIGTTKTGYV